ncbi:MAG: hypothetical protein CTY22_00525 [Methylomonas sp.]|nr:MAG: hypothetical protein CTY23_01645 [Methylomonas sp.]PPD27921.1 MAG: hypothetical protein CTY22_00525 [Methylomonas sp.]PPD40031.1 MAG: hypothetical protein CTY21_00525 [Methylomonas sp.]PPD41581.1 MAG: hypothetical protein CTY17_03625 [Methylomonas sp.]PPD51974.1 MAG: hypothetical protein CTY11_10160 [Methylomonas sp.]
MKIKYPTHALLVVFLCAVSVSAGAAEYIYRDLMGNTLNSAKCDTEAAAMQNASKSYNIDRYSKRFCQSQGYGWHVDDVKSPGKTVCVPCDKQTGLQKCRQEDVVVTCKRIKPGSVGMLPGKG